MSQQDPYTQVYFFEQESHRPTASEWAKHFALLAVTFVTATIAGSLYPFGRIQIFPDADPRTWPEIIQFLLTLPLRYVDLIVGTVSYLASNTEALIYGLSFSGSLLFILVSHEMGHYIACRIYRVHATLPYFIPTPPMIGPAGTFGAFIKILYPMPSRKAVFDIGVAGPIAGFIALLPIAIVGVLTAKPFPPEYMMNYSGIIFSDPLLMRAIGFAAGIDITYVQGNAFYYAGWVGLLVTALNLIPSGQLDGGHAIYAVFGERVHKWTGRIAFIIMATLSVLGFLYFNSPSGFLIAVLLGIMMRVGHPQPWDDSPLDLKRKLIAAATLVIFALSFLPFPIKVMY